MTNSHLDSLYQEAQAALKARDYEYACELLKRILAVDEEYQDTSRLLSRAVRLRKRRWYNDPRLWGILGAVGVFVLGFMIAPWIKNIFASPVLTITPNPNTTSTAKPTATPTKIPFPSPSNTFAPTSLPGNVVVPIEEMVSNIPWLPLDPDAAPGVVWVGFNINNPPFNNPLVRQAFAAALDRQALANISKDYGAKNAKPATSFTPSETLGRDLYGQVGIPFNPDHARELFSQAGYTDGETFPTITVYTQSTEIYVPLFNSIVRMWEENLNIKVSVKFIEIQSDYIDLLFNANPPSVYRFGWHADINDPDTFLKVFHSSSEWNISGFTNSKFDQLIGQANQTANPVERQELYILAERILCEEEVPIIPLFHFSVGE